MLFGSFSRNSKLHARVKLVCRDHGSLVLSTTRCSIARRLLKVQFCFSSSNDCLLCDQAADDNLLTFQRKVNIAHLLFPLGSLLNRTKGPLFLCFKNLFRAVFALQEWRQSIKEKYHRRLYHDLQSFVFLRFLPWYTMCVRVSVSSRNSCETFMLLLSFPAWAKMDCLPICPENLLFLLEKKPMLFARSSCQFPQGRRKKNFVHFPKEIAVEIQKALPTLS